MKTLHVELGERSYPIYIGPDLLTQGELIKPHLKGNQLLIVSNETVAPLYLKKLQSALAGIPHEVLILPDGEVYKTLETANKIYTALLEHRFNRNCTLIALGGGVIGDITGFAAASYQRGVAFIQIPTTLLAQVDSSVGGKTGVNHPLGKNMIGAFHQPQCVLADTSTLNTLEDNQLASGIAEVIKYGLIRDPEFLQWIEQHIEDIRNRDPHALSYAIERSCQNKADVVAADEREGGQRALLNLGHTFGHAIETGMGYGTWLHGEAVATGMLMAADLSARQGWISQQDVTRVRKLLLASRLPIKSPAEMDIDRFMELMAVDKKVLNGVLRLVLLKTMGNAIISDDFNPQYLQQTLSEI
ncbi:MAG: 3-dehydroquinate synthase [Gammaproteobacteria bacterium]|nr:3-dehydroquinate synthase [Gammaproteobacteria bacterium]